MMSPKKLASWVCAVALVIPVVASAGPVTLDFSGTFVSHDNPDGSSLVGMPYTGTVTFDPADFPLGVSCLSDGAGGCASSYSSSGPTLEFSLDIAGHDCDSDTPEHDSCVPDTGSASVAVAWLYDNFTLPVGDGTTGVFDGLRISLFPDGYSVGAERWNLLLLGPTDLFSTSTAGLPDSTFDSTLFGFSRFEYCDAITGVDGAGSTTGLAFSTCAPDAEAVVGDNINRDVPEPGTMALLGLGLGGVMVARRRRMVV